MNSTNILNPFPDGIFPAEIESNFKAIAQHENIPPDFLFTAGLFAIASLSGNMFYHQTKGKMIKPIMYFSLVAPSGIGKSPAYSIPISSVLEPLRAYDVEQYKVKFEDWKRAKADAGKSKTEFDDPQPMLRVRMVEVGTLESFMKYMECSPAGYGLYQDEGGQLFAQGYNKAANPDDFWNTNFNGRMYHQLRVDSDRERFIRNPAISLLIGIQTSKLPVYFSKDNVESGLFNRFLFAISDYKPLNNHYDIDAHSARPCELWCDTIKHLYRRGLTFEADQAKLIDVKADAKAEINRYSSGMIGNTNKHIEGRERASSIDLTLAYDSKLFTYFHKFCMILAILNNPQNPIITLKIVKAAELLYVYYKRNAHAILRGIFDEIETGMDMHTKRIFDVLPNQFNSSTAAAICALEGYNETFFHVKFNRGAFGKSIIKIGRGTYEKS